MGLITYTDVYTCGHRIVGYVADNGAGSKEFSKSTECPTCAYRTYLRSRGFSEDKIAEKIKV